MTALWRNASQSTPRSAAAGNAGSLRPSRHRRAPRSDTGELPAPTGENKPTCSLPPSPPAGLLGGHPRAGGRCPADSPTRKSLVHSCLTHDLFGLDVLTITQAVS